MRILKHEDVLTRLVKKYNKGEWDEDLMQEAWLAAIKCEQANPDADDNELLGKMIVWVKNRLINIQTKKHPKTTPILEDWDFEDVKSLDMKIFETRESLKDKDLEIFNLLLDGKQASEIVEITKLSKSEVYRIFDKIKGILRD